MKSIGILINTLYFGGAEKQAVILAQEMCKQYHVHFFVLDGQKVEPRLQSSLIEPNITFYALKGGFFTNTIKIFKYLKTKKISIIFSFLATSNVIAAVSGNLAGVDKIYMSIRSSWIPFKKRLIQKLLHNHFTSGTIFNSYQGRDIMLKHGFRQNKAFVIHNCIDTQPVLSKKSKLERKIRIISVGRFVKEKNFDLAIDVVAKLLLINKYDFELYIAGYGPLEQELRSKIIKLKLEGNIKLLISPNVNLVLATSDIYLSTSKVEGMSNSIMEAMAYGIPVVATDVGDTKFLVENTVTGFLVKNGDAFSILNSLKALLESNSLRMKYGNSGFRKISTQFSVSKFASSYISLINNK